MMSKGTDGLNQGSIMGNEKEEMDIKYKLELT